MTIGFIPFALRWIYNLLLNVVFPEDEGPAIVTNFIFLLSEICSAILAISLWCRGSFYASFFTHRFYQM